MKNSKKLLLILSLSTLALLSGCSSLKPTAVTEQAQLDNTHFAIKRIFEKQEQMSASVGLPEVIARTLKFNLEDRLRRAQTLIENGNLTLAKLEMMPAVNLNAEHTFRNNKEIQNLIEDGQIVSGQQSFTPQKVTNHSEEIHWNMLDFGLSYVRAQQQANKVMAVEEQKRKMTQQLIQEATTAYWKAWTAQEMALDVEAYKQKVTEALSRSRSLTAQAVGDSQAELDYQQVLLRALRRVNQLQLQTIDAKSQLMELMNVAPTSEFKIEQPTKDITQLPEITVDLEKLDTLALVYRPELREASYEKIIQEKGIRVAMLNMLPSISVDYGYNYTSNEFMKNRKWSGGDYSATWNILRSVIRGPFDVKVARQSTELQELKEAATTMAVLTQVRTAAHGYLLAREDYQYADEDAKVTEDLFQRSLNLEQASQGNAQLTIRRGIERLNTVFEKQVAMTKAQEALSRLYQSVGIDIIVDTDRDMPLAELSKKVESILAAESRGNFNAVVDQRYAQLKHLLSSEPSAPAIDIKPKEMPVIPAPVATPEVKPSAPSAAPAVSTPVVKEVLAPAPASGAAVVEKAQGPKG